MIQQFINKKVYISLILAIVLVVSHFFYYLSKIPENLIDDYSKNNIEGVVVLTGDSNRISSGLKILKNGVGERLLISGVNSKITNLRIRSLYANDAFSNNLFDCCVDIDRISKNTFENSREAYLWSRNFNYKNLIIVTSDYHIPRVKLEFSRFHDANILYYHAANITDITQSTNLLLMVKKLGLEYIKYVRASLSLLIGI